MKSLNFKEELSLLIRAKCPIIYVVTWEEERAEKAIAQVAKECGPPRQMHYYDLVRGFEHNQEGKNNLLQALQIVETSDRQAFSQFTEDFDSIESLTGDAFGTRRTGCGALLPIA